MSKKAATPSSRVRSQKNKEHRLNEIRAAKQEWAARLLQRPSTASPARSGAITPDPARNLVGVGIGEKLVDGQPTGVLAVKFLVRAKYRKTHINPKHLLPKSIGGLPADVEQVGLFRSFEALPLPLPTFMASLASSIDPRSTVRPAQPGCSIGYVDPTGSSVVAATFGALVNDAEGTYILSNNHAIADLNLLAAGAPILQPGTLDGGDPVSGQIAELTRFIPLQPNVLNQFDCAIAKISDPAAVSNAILQIGPPSGVKAAQIDMTVEKFGRSTGYTVGQITSIETDITVQYNDAQSFTFGGQIIVTGLQGNDFSQEGDSGALIVERNSKMAVGLLFAGTPTHTAANHITGVLSALQVNLA
jgi:hypothetical protein